MKNHLKYFSLFFLTLFPGVVTIAQKEVPESDFFSSIRANQIDSYVTFMQGIGNLEPLVFEAMVAPVFLLRTNRKAQYGATLSTAIRLRMYAVESTPVRSPSYMPNVTFYHNIPNFHPDNDGSNYVFLMLGHHSNGQEGEFFLPDGSYNTQTGNFSTNYLEFGMFFNQKIVPFSNTSEYFKTSIEWHPKIEMSPELEGRYGFLRLHNSISINRFSFGNVKSIFKNASQAYDEVPRVQLNVETTWIFGERNKAKTFDLSERFNLNLKIAFRPKVLKDVSLFARLYSGEDYYNMFFYRRINFLQVGLQAFAF
ncbi:MAG: hypothetical protein CVT92_10325 [Bacteroidetes bacterium HGW-Bacteroidetes-1]|jgi:hypothetical protein|nr:MAG: hypothetical protein CVT92_10325 [Bacteroidetes bacterium HGW-Bacteroidetes-1]